MKASKTLRFDNKGVDLSKLEMDIASYLRTDGFKVQEPPMTSSRLLIQAQKGGFLRDIITAERALNVMIEGSPNDFTVTVGIGKWLQNIAVAAAETIVISELFLPLDVAEMLWNLNVEQKVVNKIEQFVNEETMTAEVHAPAA